MTRSPLDSGLIHEARLMLTDEIPLQVYLVKGADYAVWIDSGIKPMFPALVDTMERAGVANSDLRFILHTHSHHDHIGCDAQMKRRTGCLIAVHRHYSHWHSDFEKHFEEFARAFPHHIPDTPELRAEVFNPLDEPHKVDLYVDEGSEFFLGGGVSLRAYSFPGHMLAELGWFETSTRTLILGDAITGLDWALFHGHLTVQGYRDTVDKLRRLLTELKVEHILMAHFAPMTPDAFVELLDRAHAYIDGIEIALLRMAAAQEQVTLVELWQGLCRRMEKLQEFRSLGMVDAHVRDLMARRVLREVAPETYTLA